jgi:hypothetical protein
MLKLLIQSRLCSIYKESVVAGSYPATQYSTRDANENKVPNIYYIVKYTLANGGRVIHQCLN